MSASLLLKTATAAIGGAFLETKYGPKNSRDGPLGLSPLFGLTPLIFSGLGFWAVAHGFKVSAARKKYADLAKEQGETEVDERYQLPNLYAQGTSKNVQAFNCIQRSHQHIFESFTQACLTGVIGALCFPMTAAISSLTYAVGRVAITNGYAAAEGDASKRYQSKLAFYHWYGLLTNMMLGMIASITIMTGKKLLK